MQPDVISAAFVAACVAAGQVRARVDRNPSPNPNPNPNPTPKPSPNPNPNPNPNTGQPANPDFNGDAREGAGLYQFMIRDGIRDSAAAAYLGLHLRPASVTVRLHANPSPNPSRSPSLA